MASTEGTVAVMGAGAWGTALAKVLAEAGGPETTIRLWARRSEIADQINTTRYNPAYLPGASLPPAIRATADAEEALSGVTTVLLGVPAQTMRANLEHWKGFFAHDATLISLAKGIELGTLMRMSQVIVSVTACRPVAGRGDFGTEPGQRDRRGPARRHRRGVQRLRPRGRLAADAEQRVLPPVHQ